MIGIMEPRWIGHGYDVLGRLYQVVNPDGTHSNWWHELGVTKVIDANGHKKEETRDAYGRLTQVREYTGVDLSFTLYATTDYQ